MTQGRVPPSRGAKPPQSEAPAAAWGIPPAPRASVPKPVKKLGELPPPTPAGVQYPPPQVPDDAVPSCPKCGGKMWDNRASKRNPKAPDFKCRDRSCEGVIWPARGQVATAPVASQAAVGWAVPPATLRADLARIATHRSEDERVAFYIESRIDEEGVSTLKHWAVAWRNDGAKDQLGLWGSLVARGLIEAKAGTWCRVCRRERCEGTEIARTHLTVGEKRGGWQCPYGCAGLQLGEKVLHEWTCEYYRREGIHDTPF